LLTPRQKLYIALPLIAVAVIVLVYFQLFSSPIVIAILFVAYVAVSLWNRRKFSRQRAQGKPGRSDSAVSSRVESPSLGPVLIGI